MALYRTAHTKHHSSHQTSFPGRLLAIVVGMIIVLIVLTIALQSCTEKRELNWSDLSFENGRMVYQENGIVTSWTGIDVSSHQKDIDWNAVAQDSIDFAMIRCGGRGYTEGGLFIDETFYRNADGAQAANIPFGVYFFSQAVNEDEAIEEAEYVLDAIQGMDIKGPIAFDQEDMPTQSARANDLSAEQLTRNAEAFCQRIEQEGYRTLIYGNQHDLNRYDLDRLSIDIWYAEYNDSHPTSNLDMVMWQYASNGSVSGISTKVDLNILFEPALFD